MQRFTVQLSNSLEDVKSVIAREAIISVEQPGLIIPQEIALQLRLEKIGIRRWIDNTGKAILVPQVGPVNMQAGKHSMTCSALVWGKEVRIGATLLSAMGWEDVKGQGWVFTDKPIRIPTVLPSNKTGLND